MAGVAWGIGFNGAAVYKPRRASNEGNSGKENQGFNGAAVYKPRRVGDTADVLQDEAASMGPRFINRGEGYEELQLVVTKSFNGAAVYKPRRGRKCEECQCPEACFNGAAVYKPRRGLRLINRVLIVDASMGPRFINRGETHSRKSFETRQLRSGLRA